MVDEWIYSLLAIAGGCAGFMCGIYILNIARKFNKDNITKVNLYGMGLVDVLMGLLFVLSLLHVDGLAISSSFSKWMRPLILLAILFPTFVAYRMGGER